MGFERVEGGWRYNFGGMKTNTAADEMPPTKYPYARNVRYTKSLQTRPGYVALFGTELLITTTCPLPSGEIGIAYTDTMENVGGLAPFTWTIDSGNLPNGLAMDTGGHITGTPTLVGSYSFVLKVTDGLGASTTKNCSATIVAAIAITTTCPLPTGMVDTAYDEQFASSGGIAPRVWTITSGALPGGLSMDSSGHVTGTPTTNEVAVFTVKVTDGLGGIDSKSCQITVTPACFEFSSDFTQANGPLPADWSIISHSSGVQPQVVSNALAASALCSVEVVAAPATNPTGFSEITWTGYTSIAWGGAMVLRNTSGINDNYYSIRCEDIGGPEPRGKISILKTLNAVISVLATVSPVQLSGNLIGLPVRLSWSISAGQVDLVAYINGVQVLTATDSSATRFTAGKPGFALGSTTGLTANTWDNYSCESCP